MKRILVALDASPVSVHAAKVAARMFRGVPDVEFLALNVASVPLAVTGDPTGGAYAIPAEVWQELETEATDVDAVEPRAHAAGIKQVEPVAELGDPVGGIVAVAEAHDVDLIVVGAHDKGFLRRLVDPSISQAVLHHTRRPVLVVHEEHTPGDGSSGHTAEAGDPDRDGPDVPEPDESDGTPTPGTAAGGDAEGGGGDA